MSIGRYVRKATKYLNPKTHIKAIKSAYRHTRKSASRFAAFQRRVVSRENLKYLGREIAEVKTKVGPWLTGGAAFIANFVPVVGNVLAVGITALGTGLSRWMGATAARGEGKKGHEARTEGRDLAKKTMKIGGIGAAAGALTSLAVATISAAPASVAPGAVPGAQVGADAGAAAAEAAAIGGVSAVQGAAVGAAAGAANAAAIGGGILGGIWGTIKDVGSFLLNIGPKAYEFYGQLRGAPGYASNGSELVGGGGVEGTGDLSAEGGGFMDDIFALPLWLKLGAGVLGIGAVAFLMRKKGR